MRLRFSIRSFGTVSTGMGANGFGVLLTITHCTVRGFGNGIVAEDRETLADAMLMRPAHAELLGRLVPGQAYIYADRFFRPHLIRVPLQVPDVPLARTAGSQAIGTPVLDGDLIGWLGKQDWYREAVVTRIEELNTVTDEELCASDAAWEDCSGDAF